MHSSPSDPPSALAKLVEQIEQDEESIWDRFDRERRGW